MTQHYSDRYYKLRFGRTMPPLSNNCKELLGITEAGRLMRLEARKRQALFSLVLFMFYVAIAL